MNTASSLSILRSLETQLELHTLLFRNVLEGISSEDGVRRISENTNHIAWLSGSLVSTRYFMVTNIGGQPVNEPFPELFAKNKGIDVSLTYPSLPTQLSEWESISTICTEGLSASTPQKLEEPSSFELPGSDQTILGALTFLIDRESYVLGQLGLLRKAFGYEAMKYN